jgi:hypothetical protein
VKVVYLVQRLKMGLIQTPQLSHGPTFLTIGKKAKNYLNEKYIIWRKYEYSLYIPTQLRNNM